MRSRLSSLGFTNFMFPKLPLPPPIYYLPDMTAAWLLTLFELDFLWWAGLIDPCGLLTDPNIYLPSLGPEIEKEVKQRSKMSIWYVCTYLLSSYEVACCSYYPVGFVRTYWVRRLYSSSRAFVSLQLPYLRYLACLDFIQGSRLHFDQQRSHCFILFPLLNDHSLVQY